MKTEYISVKRHNASPNRRYHWKAATIAAMAALLLPFIAEAGAPIRRSAESDPCIVTARYMRRAAQYSALDDYNVALANANNQPTSETRAAARKQSREDYEDAVDLANAQFHERRDLCEELDEERYNPVIKPADFLSVAETAATPNPLFPLVPGTTYNFRSVSAEGTETVEFAVTRETRSILGVTCIVVRDTVRVDGKVQEDTVDWFAQDRSGNVWYFGENTAEYEGGLITTTAGSWEAGVEGAKAGIIMFAKPVVGKVYRQELFLGEAEDAAEVLALNETVTVAAGTYTNCLKTEDFTPIDPDNKEFKYYAPGIGNVLTINPDTGKRAELISVVRN
jgi:hypothetical protein